MVSSASVVQNQKKIDIIRTGRVSSRPVFVVLNHYAYARSGYSH
jgi:hypothetical protein